MRYVIAIVIICVFGLGFTTGVNYQQGRGSPPPNTPTHTGSRSLIEPMMTRIELQERLGVKPDGKIGPKTIAAWERWEKEYFNKLAGQYYTATGKPKGE